jgi:hypothetical protein
VKVLDKELFFKSLAGLKQSVDNLPFGTGEHLEYFLQFAKQADALVGGEPHMFPQEDGTAKEESYYIGFLKWITSGPVFMIFNDDRLVEEFKTYTEK